MSIAPSSSLRTTKLPWLRQSASRPLTRFVGIDLGVDHVHVVSLGIGYRDAHRRSGAARGAFRWLSRYRFALPIDPLSAPPLDWVNRAVSTLQEKLPRCIDGDDCLTAVSLPLPWVHYQVVAASELDECRRQCDAMFDSSLFRSHAHLGHWPLQFDSESGKNKQCVVAAVAESAAVDVAEAIGRVGYQVEKIVPRGVALVDAAESLTSVDPDCVVLLGHSGGLIAMKNAQGCGICRPLPALPAQVVASARPHGLTLPAIRPWLSDVAAEVTATRRYAQRSQRAPDAAKPVLLCGDIAALDGIDSMLATLTGAPVARWCYAGKTRLPHRDAGRGQEANPHQGLPADAEYATALSLAHAVMQFNTGGAQP